MVGDDVGATRDFWRFQGNSCEASTTMSLTRHRSAWTIHILLYPLLDYVKHDLPDDQPDI